MDLQARLEELEALKARVDKLEAELTTEAARPGWRATEYYAAYYATAGFLLGSFGAMASLLFNVVGALAVGKNPVELIRVYLTFPLGEKALLLPRGRKSTP